MLYNTVLSFSMWQEPILPLDDLYLRGSSLDAGYKPTPNLTP